MGKTSTETERLEGEKNVTSLSHFTSVNHSARRLSLRELRLAVRPYVEVETPSAPSASWGWGCGASATPWASTLRQNPDLRSVAERRPKIQESGEGAIMAKINCPIDETSSYTVFIPKKLF